MGARSAVDVAGVVEFVQAADRFEWTWSVADIERFCDTVGWVPERRDEPTVVRAVREAEMGGYYAYFELRDEVIERIAFLSVEIPDSAEPEAVVDAFQQTDSTLADVLGAPDLHETVAGLMSWWRLPRFTVELVMGHRSVVVALVRPSEVRVAETRTAVSGYIAAKWEGFATTLTAFLQHMPQGAKLILETTGNRYVQFAQEDSDLYAEVASNKFLVQPMTREAEQLMVDGGWTALKKRGKHAGNWYRSVLCPCTTAEYTALADATTIALRDALHVHTAWELAAHGWIDPPAQFDLSTLAPVVGSIRTGP